MLEIHDYLVSSSDPREIPRELFKNHFEAASNVLTISLHIWNVGVNSVWVCLWFLMRLECILLNTILIASKQTENLASHVEKASLL